MKKKEKPSKRIIAIMDELGLKFDGNKFEDDEITIDKLKQSKNNLDIVTASFLIYLDEEKNKR
jgi:hypothetical protein